MSYKNTTLLIHFLFISSFAIEVHQEDPKSNVLISA